MTRKAASTLLFLLLALFAGTPAQADTCGTTWVVAIASYVPQTIWHEYFSFETMIMIRSGYISSDSIKDLMEYQKHIDGLLLRDIKAKEREYKAEIKINTYFSSLIHSEESNCSSVVLGRKSSKIIEYISDLWKKKPLGSLQFKEDLENFILTYQP